MYCYNICHVYSMCVLANFTNVCIINVAGCDPFSEFTIGVSLEPFIQHLKGGAHPSQPEGLSESM